MSKIPKLFTNLQDADKYSSELWGNAYDQKKIAIFEIRTFFLFLALSNSVLLTRRHSISCDGCWKKIGQFLDGEVFLGASFFQNWISGLPIGWLDAASRQPTLAGGEFGMDGWTVHPARHHVYHNRAM